MRPLCGEQRRVARDGEVYARERHEVRLKLVQVDVKRTLEAERRSDRGDDLCDQPVEVRKARHRDAELMLVDVVDCLVVDLVVIEPWTLPPFRRWHSP